MIVRSLALGSILFMISSCASAARDTAPTSVPPLPSTCPAPTVPDGPGRCKLEKDVELTSTLRLGSSTRLNCKGHSIVPSALGVDSPDETVFKPSQPEVAILVKDA